MLFNKEYKCTCKKCDSSWYITKKDIRENRRLKNLMHYTQFNLRFAFHTHKTMRRLIEQHSQMKVAFKDYSRCPVCGSRSIIKLTEGGLLKTLQEKLNL